MKLDFLRYPNEDDEAFAYRIKRVCKLFKVKMLIPTARTQEQVRVGVTLTKIETDNGTRYIYETNEDR